MINHHGFYRYDSRSSFENMSDPTASIATASTDTKASASIAMGSTACTSMTDLPRKSRLAVTSLVFGVIGIVTVTFGVVFGPLAITFGALAQNEMRAKPDQVQGLCMAKAGIVCGIVAIIVDIVIFNLWIDI